MGRIKYYFNKFKYDEYWEIVVRNKKKFNDFDYNNHVFLLKSSTRYWYADPFLIDKEDKTYLFFEMFDRLKNKGVISYVELSDNGSMSKIKKIIEEKTHLSYPYIFVYNDDYYMIPESSSSSDIKVYIATDFPNKWIKIKTIMSSIKAVDSNILKDNNKYFFVSSVMIDGANFNQELFFEINMDNFEPCSPLHFGKKDTRGIRNAGEFIYKEDSYIKLTQNCSNDSYGEGIYFTEYKNNEIINNKYVSYKNINYNNNKHVGFHTYSYSNKFEAIDLKYRRKNSLLRRIYLLFVVFVNKIKGVRNKND